MVSRRREFYNLGEATVDRIIELFNGTKATKHESPNPQAQRLSGTNYEPDIEVTYQDTKYALEVKGMNFHIVRTIKNGSGASKGKIYKNIEDLSNLKLLRCQWDNLVRWAQEHNSEPAVLVELKTKSPTAPYFYILLDKKLMEFFITKYKGIWISVGVWNILYYGKRLFQEQQIKEVELIV